MPTGTAARVGGRFGQAARVAGVVMMASYSTGSICRVALAGSRIEEARARLRKSIDAYTPAQARARAFSLGKLTILELQVGDTERGIDYGGEALDADASLKSRRPRMISRRSARRWQNTRV